MEESQVKEPRVNLSQCRQMIAVGTVMEGGNAGKLMGKLSHRLSTATKRAMEYESLYNWW